MGQYNKYIVGNVPLTGNDYTVAIDVPGHFTYSNVIGPALKVGDVSIGKDAKVSEAYVVAGDVNKDNVIDIMDALAIQANWGTNNRAADINFDGVVNEKDIKFVKTNYLKQNSMLKYSKPGISPKPKKEYNGKNIRIDNS